MGKHSDPRDCVGCMHDFGFCAVHGRCSMATDAAALAATVLTGTRLDHSLVSCESRRRTGVSSGKTWHSSSWRRSRHWGTCTTSAMPRRLQGCTLWMEQTSCGGMLVGSGRFRTLPGTRLHVGSTRHEAWYLEVECPLLSDQRLLWVADFTTSPTGDRIGAQARIHDIRSRYSLDSPVVAALKASLPSMNEALMAVGVDDRVRL